jgi:hypothetical protein
MLKRPVVGTFNVAESLSSASSLASLAHNNQHIWPIARHLWFAHDAVT